MLLSEPYAFPVPATSTGDGSPSPTPAASGVWLATEYIPPAADQNPLDNWGTYVFEMNPFSFGH